MVEDSNRNEVSRSILRVLECQSSRIGTGSSVALLHQTAVDCTPSIQPSTSPLPSTPNLSR